MAPISMGALIGMGALNGIRALINRHIRRGALIRKGALIGRRALNRIITVCSMYEEFKESPTGCVRSSRELFDLECQ